MPITQSEGVLGAANEAPKASIVPATAVPAGDQVLVNTFTDTSQGGASIAGLPGGAYVIAWTTLDSNGIGVSAQLFNADGSKSGGEFTVNTHVASTQSEPSIATLSSGEFVISWSSSAQDGSGADVFAQRFNADGAKLGSEFQVNTYTSSDQFGPCVAALDDGGFLVTWMSFGQVGPISIYGQRYNADGSRSGDEFALESQTGQQYGPDVAVLANGAFVVTWTGNLFNGNSDDIYAQIFDADGSKAGSEFLVNTDVEGWQRDASVASLAGGGFVVAWESLGGGVRAQRFNGDGSKEGAEFNVPLVAATGAQMPSVMGTDDGGFLIVWSGVSGQQFAADGSRVGPEFEINSSPSTWGHNPFVAPVRDGYVVAWEDPDAAQFGIHARRFISGNIAVEQLPFNLKGILNISDPDAGEGILTVTLSVGSGVLDVAAGDSGASVIAGNGSASLTLSGSLEQITTLLSADGTGTVTFTANNDAPASTSLTLEVNDNGNTGSGGPQTASASQIITVSPVNDAPTMSGLAGDNAAFKEGDGAVLLDAGGDAVIADLDSFDFDTGRLSVVIAEGQIPSQDRVMIPNQGTAPGEIGTTQFEVTFGGTVIGNYTGGFIHFLDVIFNGNATVEAVQALVRSISYSNSQLDNPTAGARVLNWTLVDGDGTANGGNDDIRFSTSVMVSAVADAPVAQPDAVWTAEHSIGTGSLFGDNGFGPDRDSDGPELAVSAVNGSASDVGMQIVLPSGALLTLNGNGTYSYDPNGAFDYLVSTATADLTGAVNDTATDNFSYTLAGGNSVTVTMTVAGFDGAGDLLLGDDNANVVTGTEETDIISGGSGSDRLSGLHGDDTLLGGDGRDTLLAGAGTDTLDGGADFDVLYFGSFLSAGDVADGGDGTDVLMLQGDYSAGYAFSAGNAANIESISIRSGEDTRWGDTANNFYDYDLTSHDANVAAGQQMIVNGQSLRAGEDFAFDGSAESDGRFLIYAGHGTDTIVGGDGNDVFFFEGPRWNTGDSVDGGAGRDAVILSAGSGINRYEFAGSEFANIESISVNNRFASDPGQVPSYELVLADGNVAPGGKLIVNGNSLGAGQTLEVDGSAVVGGYLQLYGGAGADTLVGGAQVDVLYGGEGIDQLTGGGGTDIFLFDALAHSAPGAADAVLDFTAGDLIDLSRIDSNTSAGAIGDQGFYSIGAAAFTGTGPGSAGQLRYENTGGASWLVQADTDGDGIADFELLVTTADADPIVASDFMM